ncbi:MAG: DUF5305 domain-containing protein, partial [Clostridiaceae bacterium]|nr:DUF5305 domain-containing protein [Clostridiaceae bacterium]
PNSLYEEKILDKDKMIITEFVDHIRAQFYYEYTSEQKADISGSYEILADVECYISQQDSQNTIWKRTFILQPEISFERSQSQDFNISKSIDIQLSQYNEFVRKVTEESKINAETKLTVYMNIDVKVETESGVVEESLSPNMVIPLDASYFNIGGALGEEKPMSIEKTVQVPIPINYTKVYVLIAVDILLIVALVYVLIFTRGVEPDPHERLLNRVFKNHGDRLVALKNKIDETFEYKYEVNSIGDLVRISDEVEKPIIYRFSEDKYEINKFYVINEGEMYFWRVEYPNVDEGEIDDISEETKKLIESIQ